MAKTKLITKRPVGWKKKFTIAALAHNLFLPATPHTHWALLLHCCYYYCTPTITTTTSTQLLPYHCTPRLHNNKHHYTHHYKKLAPNTPHSLYYITYSTHLSIFIILSSTTTSTTTISLQHTHTYKLIVASPPTGGILLFSKQREQPAGTLFSGLLAVRHRGCCFPTHSASQY